MEIENFQRNPFAARKQIATKECRNQSVSQSIEPLQLSAPKFRRRAIS